MGQDPGKSIEQVMEDLNRMLSNIGRGKKGGGGGNGGQPPSGDGNSNSNFLVIGGMIVLVLLIIRGVMTSYYTVNQSELGVVTRFGKYARTDPPGLHFKIPFGIEKNINVPAQDLLKEEFGFRTQDTRGPVTRYTKRTLDGESMILSGDLNIADVEWVVQYTISDPVKYLFNTANPTKNIRDISISVMRRAIGDRLYLDVLGKAKQDIPALVKQISQEIFNQYDMGITVQNIAIKSALPPEEVMPAFNEVIAAIQEQKQFINKAEQEYNKVIPEAKGKAAKVIANAEAYATEVLNHSKGDAERFSTVLKSYKLAPAITRQRLYLEAMQEVFDDADRFTIVDSKISGLLPIYGNLEKKAQ